MSFALIWVPVLHQGRHGMHNDHLHNDHHNDYELTWTLTFGIIHVLIIRGIAYHWWHCYICNSDTDKCYFGVVTDVSVRWSFKFVSNWEFLYNDIAWYPKLVIEHMCFIKDIRYTWTLPCILCVDFEFEIKLLQLITFSFKRFFWNLWISIALKCKFCSLESINVKNYGIWW